MKVENDLEHDWSKVVQEVDSDFIERHAWTLQGRK